MTDGEGEAAQGTLTCPEDGVSTRLRCAGCRTPVCPACLVRTEVGIKCEKCAAPIAAPAVGPPAARRRSPAVAVLVASLALAGGVALVVTRPHASRTGLDDIIGPTTTAAGSSTMASGSLPDGFRWEISARRNERGELCTVFRRGTDAVAPPERCQRTPDRSVFPMISRGPEGPGQSTWLLWGAVADGAGSVRVSPSDAPTVDVPAVGEPGFGVRFYVTPVPREASIRLVALGPNGEQIGAVTVPPVPAG